MMEAKTRTLQHAQSAQTVPTAVHVICSSVRGCASLVLSQLMRSPSVTPSWPLETWPTSPLQGAVFFRNGTLVQCPLARRSMCKLTNVMRALVVITHRARRRCNHD